jgi:hypothetical protein
LTCPVLTGRAGDSTPARGVCAAADASRMLTPVQARHRLGAVQGGSSRDTAPGGRSASWPLVLDEVAPTGKNYGCTLKNVDMRIEQFRGAGQPLSSGHSGLSLKGRRRRTAVCRTAAGRRRLTWRLNALHTITDE